MRDLIQKASQEILPTTFLDYRLYLKSIYDFLKKENDEYSYQSFASDLGFSRSTIMHQLIRGYRPLTVKNAEKIGNGLGLTGRERRYFITLVAHANAKSSIKRQEFFEQILRLKAGTLETEVDKDLLAYFSEWYHPVIREMVAGKSFKNDPNWIASHMTPRIRPEQARASMELLERLGYIKIDQASGQVQQTKTRVTTGHQLKGLALVAYHQQMIEHGRESLTRISSERRDVSGVTVCTTEETAKRLRTMIHAFELQLLDEAERAGSGDQVFQINVQLFPFTE